MEMLQEFRRLFAYDVWANREVLASIKKCDRPTQALQRLAHILSAERLWLERLLNAKQTHAVWPQFSPEQCEHEMEDMARRWSEYLGGMMPGSLEQLVHYKNTKGEPWTSKVGDILMHVVMHSAYHRGQIASDMRAADCIPVLTDFIHCVRQGLVD